jgi:tRNA pseudouridine55 synthase
MLAFLGPLTPQCQDVLLPLQDVHSILPSPVLCYLLNHVHMACGWVASNGPCSIPLSGAGAATRLTPKLEALPRTYTGSIRLGISTDTYDASGQPLSSGPWAHLSDMDITAAAASFTGEVLQVPCMWSSSKFNSRPLRWYAQRGQTVARPPRAVTIESLSVWRDPTTPAAGVGISSGSGSATQQQQQRRQQQPQQQVDPQQQQQVDPQQQQQQQQKQSDLVHFRAVASRGASMRVLADDLGRALGCGAHLAALRREAIGGFSVETAWRLDVLLPMAQKYAKGFRNTPALPP